MKKYLFLYMIPFLVVLMIANHANAGVPSISGLSDFESTEQDPPAVIDSNISFSGGVSYADGYLRFSLSDETSADQMVLSSDPDPNASGAISVSGGDVYLGNGSGNDRIGAIDSVENGEDGQPLKILFSSPLENAGFETNSTDGWDVYTEDYGTGFNGQSIPYVYSGGSGTATILMGAMNSMDFNVEVQTARVSTGTYALRLYSNGHITCSNPGAGNNPDGYCSLHGPRIVSSEFTAENGDQLYVDWAAQDGGDWYEVFGYLIEDGPDNVFDTADDTRTPLFSQRGDTQDWVTTSQTITSAGTYKFEFICGTYDYTGLLLVGASLYVDNIRVVNATAVTDAVVTNIARLVTFENTSDDPPTADRTLTVEAKAEDGSTGSDTATITITPVNDDPTDITLSATEIDVTSGVNGVVGSLSTADPDSSSFTYRLVSGAGDTDNALFNISGDQLRANDADMAIGSYSIRIESDDGAGGTVAERFSLTVSDTDGDGVPDYQETADGTDPAEDTDYTDSDGDGVPDYVEEHDSPPTDPNDSTDFTDTDGDGIPDYVDTDSDNDGIDDADEGNGDTDGDGTPDYQDTDSDNDGIDDSVEGNVDTDSDGTPDYQDTECDGDGVDDEVENGGANSGDGNDDGIPDRLQSRVTTLRTFDETVYVTFESPDGTTLTHVQAIDNPSPDSIPTGSTLTHGLFNFTINGVGDDGSTQLTLYLPDAARPESYLNYGRTPDHEADHWYEFVYDGVVGAEIDANVITLHFVDGDEGDNLIIPDGMVIYTGGPMLDTAAADTTVAGDSDGYGPTGGGGCFVDNLMPDDRSMDCIGGLAAWLLAALTCLLVLTRFRPASQMLVVGGLVTMLLMVMPGTARSDEPVDGAATDTSVYSSPFYLNAGIGFTYIDESIQANYLGNDYELTVDNDIYPIFRFGYAFSKNVALELGFRWDIYSGKMAGVDTGGSGSPKGYTFLFGPVYTFGEYRCKYLGPLKPMVHLNLGYTMLHDDLDYPSAAFAPAFGGDIAVGLQRKNIDLRLGYRYFELDRDRTLEGVSGGNDSLNLSGFFMELSYRFRPWW